MYYPNKQVKKVLLDFLSKKYSREHRSILESTKGKQNVTGYKLTSSRKAIIKRIPILDNHQHGIPLYQYQQNSNRFFKKLW